MPLRVAASLVYFQLRHHLTVQHDVDLDRKLNDAAHALCQIADVYYETKLGKVLRIPSADLYLGTFEGGATLLRVPHVTYGNLSMRRVDVMMAMDVLKKAASAFTTAASTAPSTREPTNRAAENQSNSTTSESR